MPIHFTKYHGTGNDFVIIDDRNEMFDIHNTELIHSMCSRRFGIGADGLILLRNKSGYDFEMVYFNSDGRQSSMCGNGGRCIVHFAYELGVFDQKCAFLAIDGPHEAIVLENEDVKLKMTEVKAIKRDADAYVMDTGSPHYVKEVDHVQDIDVKIEGALIRYSEAYKKTGINVNFLERKGNGIEVATYERGVEDETFSCGTGVTAAALSAHEMDGDTFQSPVLISTKGGQLKVYFKRNGNGSYSEVWLEGPAVSTFQGTFEP